MSSSPKLSTLFLSSVTLLIVLGNVVESFPKKKEVVIIKQSTGHIDQIKKKAEMIGLATGGAVGIGKAYLKAPIKEPVIKTIYTEAAPHSPKFKVKWIQHTVPVLVPEPSTPRKLYTKKTLVSHKKTNLVKAGIFPYMKGFFKGKILGKSIGKTVVKVAKDHQ